ncbi:MAG TPA: hypothetical protein ACFCUY_05315 [Xenococcaceae cyanobacterium]
MLIKTNWFIVANSVIFWLTPILLVIQLASNQNLTNAAKKRLAYIYGGIWAIAFLGYGLIFRWH